MVIKITFTMHIHRYYCMPEVLCIVLIVRWHTHYSIASLSSDYGNQSLELLPGHSHACIHLNVSSNEQLSFFVTSKDVIEIRNPNGTIIGTYMHTLCNI